MTDIIRQAIHIDDLLALDEDRRFEVVDGILTESSMPAAGFLHVIIIDNLYDILKPHIKQHKLGHFHTDGITFILHQTDDGIQTARIPDLCYISHDRIPSDSDWSKPFSGTPNIAIEVVSPSENVGIIQAKTDDYLAYGSEQVWVVYPEGKQLHIHDHTTPDIIRVYHQNDHFADNRIFPDLQFRLADIFKIDNEG
jgi:Uma2 family endonuclease